MTVIDVQEGLKLLAVPDWIRWEQHPHLYPRAVVVQTGDDTRLDTALVTIRDLRPRTHPILILSGGSSQNPDVLAQGFSTAPELEKRVPAMCRALGMKGAPQIVVDNRASNTLESAQNTLPILLHHRVSTAIIAMTPQHILRCLLTMRKWFDEHGGREIILLVSVSEPNYDLLNLDKQIQGEIERIERYSPQGHCYASVEAAMKANPFAWLSHQ